VIESQADPELLEIHNKSDLTVPDGVPLVWAGRYAGAGEIEHVRGPDLMPAVCELAAKKGWRSFFYGGGPGVADRIAKSMCERFPGFQVGGVYTPPFRALTAEEDAEVVRLINDSGSRLVWVGLSTPKQERWMASHVDRLSGPLVMFGVGAAFDIHAGLVKDSPRWTRPLGFQWAYRMIREPRRLWRRYLTVVPRFLLMILRRRPFLRA
jgi:N-acetylglucosaminyldiphosphoundecaprenol N-acetyl-beta-D-mannosaminyltransferase